MPSKCRSCGKPIEWVELTSGKKHPVNPEYVDFDNANLGDKLVTNGGNIVVKGRNERRPSIKGRISHFATCPQGGSWRRK